ncbi:MAG: heavy-metal-associated domain-containing protein, partial [Nocardioidaceae bacterium]
MHKSYAVAGMTCEHCANAVREEIGELEGVESVAVDLVPGGTSNVAVTSDRPLADEQVVDALTEAGDY